MMNDDLKLRFNDERRTMHDPKTETNGLFAALFIIHHSVFIVVIIPVSRLTPSPPRGVSHYRQLPTADTMLSLMRLRVSGSRRRISSSRFRITPASKSNAGMRATLSTAR